MTAQAASGFPSAGEFLTSAGFGGAAELLAALVVALIVYVVARKVSQRHHEDLLLQERHYDDVRADRERAADIALCEQRFRWVVETAGLEPVASEGATLGLGPEVALELLVGLQSDATRLGDDTLARAVAVYLNQFALVLAQQSGPLARLNGEPKNERVATSSADLGEGNSAADIAQPEPDSSATENSAGLEASSEADTTAASGSAPSRRRRTR